MGKRYFNGEHVQVLRNGAEVVRRAFRQGCGWLFLARWEKNGRTEWVTWWATDEGDCYWGHYFRDVDKANGDFEERLGFRMGRA